MCSRINKSMENVKGEATIDFEQQTVLIYITKLSPLLNKEVREHIPVNFNKQMCKKIKICLSCRIDE